MTPAPLLLVVGGPNGAGKSTAIAQLRPPGEAVNVDEIASTLGGPTTGRNARAARLAIGRIDALLDARQDFNFETTLSSQQALNVMSRAKDRGYRVELAFIILRSPDLHVARVKQRVAQGGHDIPIETIRRRYGRSLDNLRQAVGLADQTIVYDNTEPTLRTLVRRTGAELLFDGLADWIADPQLVRAITVAVN